MKASMFQIQDESKLSQTAKYYVQYNL